MYRTESDPIVVPVRRSVVRQADRVSQRPIAQSIKRVQDCILAVLLLASFAPLIALLALAVRAKLGSPILFCQVRPGLNGAPFRMFKFRTMTDERDAHGELLPDSERLTRFGRFLRQTSLDELPEVWNVLKGDMSFVGPRPLLLDYLPLYSPEQARRHATRPGITGWAQVNGRNALDWDEKLALDVWYVNHWSLGLDLKILFMTVWCVCSQGHQRAWGSDREQVRGSASSEAPGSLGRRKATERSSRMQPWQRVGAASIFLTMHGRRWIRTGHWPVVGDSLGLRRPMHRI